ncbi:response regulator transcription factor [Paenibacillus dendritiformis]|uniref:Response regulator with CheY-like receiver domain and winged-helix DNA-binding domain n=1 Tax=Paenibacillus dendritiformis C454 TaxID=1131935 RepID=H3SAX0_9BACL|nr:response regulator transcription factor [Paenibacillus dendritiformis]EHQ63703.1 response regulator with CheY-like receiver domain and winged-helix DNA-binding domain [Paenibacillus dendritiformis C454]PZM67418.1 DNA-binding response regulator [Paenibacillus dendritiformis]TDL57603.1 response regulator transcription factor [Paenibacillus dendritiformis]WGU94532.1 response regulator transcription factor [Paenibacillus dendritiformis]CAH8772533.1 response regulator transcription factor [Paeni
MDIMIVEDEASVRDILKSYFVNEGWKVHLSSDGQEAMKKVQLYKLDLIVLDLMIPGMPGEEVCRNIRRMSNVPLIMITSKAREVDMINGLNLGADDYITKPFRAKEVIARIHALQRRINIMNNSSRNVIYFNRRRFMVNFELEDVFLDGKPANLTATEFRTLSILVRKPGKVFSRHDLSYEVQGYRFIGDGRVMDVHIRNIRKKIEEDPKNPQYIVTKIGSGYKFNFPLDDD